MNLVDLGDALLDALDHVRTDFGFAVRDAEMLSLAPDDLGGAVRIGMSGASRHQRAALEMFDGSLLDELPIWKTTKPVEGSA